MSKSIMTAPGLNNYCPATMRPLSRNPLCAAGAPPLAECYRLTRTVEHAHFRLLMGKFIAFELPNRRAPCGTNREILSVPGDCNIADIARYLLENLCRVLSQIFSASGFLSPVISHSREVSSVESKANIHPRGTFDIFVHQRLTGLRIEHLDIQFAGHCDARTIGTPSDRAHRVAANRADDSALPQIVTFQDSRGSGARERLLDTRKSLSSTWMKAAEVWMRRGR